MSDDVFTRLMGGLNSALEHAKGTPPAGSRVFVPESLNVAAIRQKTGLSQADFAGSIGVSARTLQNWEQGHRRPEGPARVLLAMVERQPHIVQGVLGNAPALEAASLNRKI